MRTCLVFLFATVLLVTPWLVASAAGWDADAAILSNGLAPTGGALLRAALALTAHVVAVIVAPMGVGATLVRAAIAAFDAWSPRRSGLSSEG